MTKPERAIPQFEVPEIEPRELYGLECQVRRLRATEAPRVLTRLLSDFGSLIAEIICSSIPQDAIKNKITKDATPAQLMKLGADTIKAVVASQAFQSLAEKFGKGEVVNLRWYMKKLLVGKLSIGGVEIQSMAELDRSKLPPLGVGQLLAFALEVNFDPTSGGLGTSRGKSDHPKAVTTTATPVASDRPQTSRSVSGVAAVPRVTGQSARQRAGSNGTSGTQSASE